MGDVLAVDGVGPVDIVAVGVGAGDILADGGHKAFLDAVGAAANLVHGRLGELGDGQVIGGHGDRAVEQHTLTGGDLHKGGHDVPAGSAVHDVFGLVLAHLEGRSGHVNGGLRESGAGKEHHQREEQSKELLHGVASFLMLVVIAKPVLRLDALRQ